MNEFAAAGLLQAAALGREILVITPRDQEATAVLEDLVLLAGDEVGQVRRAKGASELRIRGTGGRIRLRSIRSQGHRGTAADVVYLDGVDPTVEQTASLAACVASRPGGRLVRA